ncbi:alpha/beta fold hydrolase [Sinorhizobium medicae]|nr:alpha/beta fold hydrolase [Sinorhizobium medicae]
MPLARIDAQEFLQARAAGLRAWGIPESELSEGRRGIVHFWGDGPDSWLGFWRSRAKIAAAHEEWVKACLCLGAAKYPVLGTDDLRGHLADQSILLSHANEGGTFERRTTIIASGSQPIDVPYHLYGHHGPERAFICLCGGLDTYKCELHLIANLLAKWVSCPVVVLDMPGTGETNTQISLNGEAFFESFFANVLPSSRRVCFIGISFGGYWALRLAFAKAVSAAVDIGGPVGIARSADASILNLPSEMRFMINAVLGKNDEAVAISNLRSLSSAIESKLDGHPAPILAINGRDDPYVPRQDLQFLRRYPTAEIIEVQNAGHCAAEKIHRLLPAVVHWIAPNLGINSIRTTIAGVLDKAIRPAWE